MSEGPTQLRSQILVVEDDSALREALRDTLTLAGYQVTTAGGGQAALDALTQSSYAMVVSDVRMEPMDGHTLLKKIKVRWPNLPVLLMTAYGTIQRAVEAMRDGAADYLVKPFEADVLIATVSRYLAPASDTGSDFVAVDTRTRELLALAERVAQSDATVMITGESGSGKEVLARYIHAQSGRAEKPFVAINCAAIPENMLEATLFGYEKGAFTGAYKSCPGKFELANAGTLLLDEISEMDLGLQAKLLRVLQEREVERLGGNKLVPLDVRVLATSNRDMRGEVTEGRFREDLFYRLNVFPLHLPPLRERPDDILPLTQRLIKRIAAAAGQPEPLLAHDAQRKLLRHAWPGNVRELDNAIQRAMILHREDTIEPQDLQFELVMPDMQLDRNEVPATHGDNVGGDLKQHEQTKILEVLQACMGNRTAAAARLGISQRTLRYKLARMREAGVAIPSAPGRESMS